jgi:hypothetical protein
VHSRPESKFPEEDRYTHQHARRNPAICRAKEWSSCFYSECPTKKTKELLMDPLVISDSR